MGNISKQNSFPGKNFTLKEGNSQQGMPSGASATQELHLKLINVKY